MNELSMIPIGTISAGIANKIMEGMYTRKPKIEDNGDMTFRKNASTLYFGIIYIIFFSAAVSLVDYFVHGIMKDSSINREMEGTIYLICYSILGVFILMGIGFIIMYFKYKIIASKDAITVTKTFVTKSIKLYDIEMITFSQVTGLVFRSANTKVVFANSTMGLIEILKFVEKNVQKYKCETAIEDAKKMINRSGINLTS